MEDYSRKLCVAYRMEALAITLSDIESDFSCLKPS